ncbi:hypothetical protein WCD74_29730 [Actinomycetospora sp. OC33-EN08]|uniref:Uncharacterized protein n=1 Tax=Actinomycetospora aurantiaca TaxID=3129233 RepID=A0ABU8MZD6_9PSEU
MIDSTAETLRRAADRLERLAARAPQGQWSARGLLASRPEVVATDADGHSEHVAEARAGTAPWIVATAPAIAAPLVAWLRATADEPGPHPPPAVDLAETVLASV